ncbi:MAG: conjugal transfer protein TraN [Alphaproteobacteria bacterium]|nr:conjugal transfer protein TraN [Bacteroidota bacterium]MBA3814535.1 conjugal transfer protein TraN [Alphaproteobacteria bacterium]
MKNWKREFFVLMIYLAFVFSFFFLLLILFSLPVKANSWHNLQQGDLTAQSLFDQMTAKKQEAGGHPFYEGISKEANYKDTVLDGQAQGAVNSDPAAQMIYQSSDARPQVKIDPVTDPLIKGSNEVMANPLEVIGGKGTQVVEVQQGGKTETVVCEESGEDSLESCARELTVRVIKTKVKKTWEGQFRYWKTRKARKHGHYLACTALRQGVMNADRQQNSDVTAAYLACMQELGGQLTAGHVSLASTPFVASQIVAVNFKMTKRKRSNRLRVSRSGYVDSNDHGTKYDLYPRIIIDFEEDSYEVLPDEWSDNCARLEERVDSGLCGYVSRICTAPHQTRIINDIPITRNCWQETMTYACSYPAKDDCGALRARGCAQINSTCKQYVGNVCVVYQQTYQCKDAPRTIFQIVGGNTPFCMDGNCRDQSWENNDELMSSVAQLSILKEMQGNLQNGFLFKGEDNRCSKYIVSFKDCCGSGKGWGNDMGLASCNAKEKLLNKRRKLGLCHFVGTYCDKKVLGQCVKKKTSYCCFSSKLLKAFQEQGRAQIGMGWGKPKHPLCRGFTISEIQRIDFSKLDLREAFEDIMKNFKPGKMGDISRQVGERLEVIKGGMVPNAKQQPNQRAGGA